MDIVTFIIGLIVIGLIAGALGRLAIPGRDPMSIPMTILVGIGGSFLGGLVGRLIFGEDSGGAPFILAVAGAALIVFLMRKMRERGTTTDADRRRV